MDGANDNSGQAGNDPSSSTLWHPEFVEKFGSLSLDSQVEDTSQIQTSSNDLSTQTASEILWSTGVLSESMTDGFYSVVPDKRIKEIFTHLPSLAELSLLEAEGFFPEVIVADTQKDKKLSWLKQLTSALVKGSNANPAINIKIIAEVVSDFYKRPTLEATSGKIASEEACQASMFRGVQMLGQIKHGSCRPRAILFKYLADTVGLQTRLMMGLPNEGANECIDSYKHMSVAVTLNSVELLIDLMRFPGQLIPQSAKAIFMTHITAEGESDSAENDSCDSPLEPNSPLYGFSERFDHESTVEREDAPQHLRRLDWANGSGLSPQSRMLRSASSISLSHSDPSVPTSFWRNSRRKVILEQHSGTANSSPDHPSFRGSGRSMLGGERKLPGAYTDESPSSSSVGASAKEARRLRRRSISITPEIGDDIVRAVRAMNRLMRERSGGSEASCPSSPNERNSTDPQKNVMALQLGELSGQSSGMYNYHGEEGNQRAMSLPSSPRRYGGQDERSSRFDHATETKSTWKKILECYSENNKPLLPYPEWNIDFSEVTVGTRVGIGFFGEVFRGLWNGTEVAIKVFLEQDLTAENMEDFCNEISILSRLRHPNVILFLGACTNPPRLSMLTEYMEMGSLYFLIHLSGQKKKLSWRRRLKMLRDICRGLMCLHRMKIVHRDLKSANCLVDKHWVVKICDFGLSKIMIETPVKATSSAGTPEWMAPELIRNEPFTEKCDIFSLGVIMWELCTLTKPWDGVPPDRVVYSVANEGSRLDIPEGPLGRLIADCWAEPSERPSCEDIISRLLDCEYALC